MKKEVKLPESVKKFMETFCQKNHEEVIDVSEINVPENDILGRKPYTVYRVITSYAAMCFHIVDIDMSIDGETIERADYCFLTTDMVDAMTERIASFRQKVTA